MKKCIRQANRKAAIFSATLLGSALILAVSFTSDPVQPVDAQQLSTSEQMLAMNDATARYEDAALYDDTHLHDTHLYDTQLYEESDEIADLFLDAPVDESAP
jgi:hypothetical protein